MIPSKKLALALLTGVALVMSSCSGVKGSGSTSTGTGGQPGGGPFTIAGSVVGLKGTGLVIEDNGNSSSDLTINADGTFTFKVAVTGAYLVLVKTQPTATPTQTCSVQNGKGTATANVTNVQVTCGSVYFVGGRVSGLAGTGMVLQDNATDNLSITGSGTVSFTFATPLAVGATYAVTISTAPSSPAQTCTINNGTGTIAGPVTNVDIVCPLPKYSISGTLIGLVDAPGPPANSVELKDNAGDDFIVTGNNSVFTLPTQITSGGTYSVTVFREPFSQPQPCNVFNANGLVTGNVSNVQIDCQHNDWAWISPDSTNTANQYATVALPPPFPDLNTPGARNYAVTWTDNVGRKWMFGGVGYPLASTPPQSVSVITDDRLNDLWVFENTTEDVGVWVPANLPICVDNSGKKFASVTSLEFLDVPGNYGTQGAGTANSTDLNPVCSTGTYPGGRWGSATWSDASGHLFLFGGQGYDSVGVSGDVFLNDLWEFTPSTGDLEGTFEGTWTWVAGPTTGNQSTTATYPGGRWGSSVVTDAARNTVWLFGGKGYDSTGTFGYLNDLWKLDVPTHTWTLVSPSSTANVKGVYGTQGVANGANNFPGGREESILWVDPTTGNVFLFGGFGLDSVGTSAGGTPGGTLNDLWEYNGAWTWLSGGGATGLANQNGVYAKQLAPDPTNLPGSRWGSVGWSDPAGNLWLFGGWGYNALAINGTGFMNDTWEYKRSGGTNQWIWWKGSSGVNQNGNYLWHISQVDNVPGARRGQALWQPDSLDFIWVFGGQGFDKSSATGNDYLNDLWHYLPFPN